MVDALIGLTTCARTSSRTAMIVREHDVEGIGVGLLREVEAAALLSVSPRLLRQLRRRGEIRYVALSARRIAYRREDLDAFVESRVSVDTVATPTRAVATSPRPNATGKVVLFSDILAEKRRV